jgi:hypothetical protein
VLGDLDERRRVGRVDEDSRTDVRRPAGDRAEIRDAAGLHLHQAQGDEGRTRLDRIGQRRE